MGVWCDCGSGVPCMVGCARATSHRLTCGGPAWFSMSAPAEAPLCPRCGKVMVVRTARRKGPHFLEGFWGCPDFPRCSGRRAGVERPVAGSLWWGVLSLLPV